METLFNLDEKTENVKQIKTFNCDVINEEFISWQELVKDFTDIKIITFSSSLSFLNKFLNYSNYENVEILFGNENVIGSFADVFEIQLETAKHINENLEKYEDLLNAINSNKCSFYVCQKKSSHKK